MLGAQMCAWEQGAEAELPSLRARLAAMSERLWAPDAGRSWEDFERRFRVADALLDRMISPVAVRAEGLAGDPGDRTFTGTLTVRLEAAPAGTIRYTLDGKEPGPDSPAYREPLKIAAKDCRGQGVAWFGGTKRHRRQASLATLRARLFGANDVPLGHERSVDFFHVVPRARYRVYPSLDVLEPRKGYYAEMPDVAAMKAERAGIWPDLMYGLPGGGRSPWEVPLGSAVVSEGTIRITESGRYAFRLEGVKGEIHVDGKKVSEEEVELKEGDHSIRVGWFYGSAYEKGLHRATYARDGAKPQDVTPLLVPASP